MPGLVIDIGNSYIKAAIFEGDNLAKVEHYKTVSLQQVEAFVAGYAISKTIISSVRKERDKWEGELNAKIPVTYFSREMAVNINNHYGTPQTLGLDRLVAVSGARQLYPDSNNLVIDAGTCISYDYIDAAGNYYGGSISPGLNMRYQALNNYTSALPLLNADEGFNGDYGTDTKTAITSGVQNGIKHELNGFIQSYNTSQKGLNILLTGGDGIFFDTLLKNSIFAPYIKNEPYLVLKGLNAAIQQHNND